MHGYCFIKVAQSRRALAAGDRDRLKRAVKEELAGLLPEDAVVDAFMDSLQAVLVRNEDADEVAHRHKNVIQRIAGLALCEKQLEVVDALKKTLDEQADEIRETIKKIGSLEA